MYFFRNISLILIFGILYSSCGSSPSDAGLDPKNPPSSEDTTPPAAPQNLIGSSDDKQVLMSWDSNSESDLDGYNLYRSSVSFDEITSISPINKNEIITKTEYTDKGVENGTTYHYRLTALDDSGNESAVSQEIKVTPFSSPPIRPPYDPPEIFDLTYTVSNSEDSDLDILVTLTFTFFDPNGIIGGIGNLEFETIHGSTGEWEFDIASQVQQGQTSGTLSTSALDNSSNNTVYTIFITDSTNLSSNKLTVSTKAKYKTISTHTIRPKPIQKK